MSDDERERSKWWARRSKAVKALAAEMFGKRILFTDHDHWPVVDVAAAYRSQSHVENDFRQMKDRRVVPFSPMFHSTDQKIRVHVHYCVLALAVARSCDAKQPTPTYR